MPLACFASCGHVEHRISAAGCSTKTFSWRPSPQSLDTLVSLDWPARQLLARSGLLVGQALDIHVTDEGDGTNRLRYFAAVAPVCQQDAGDVDAEALPPAFVVPDTVAADSEARRFYLYDAIAARLKGVCVWACCCGGRDVRGLRSVLASPVFAEAASEDGTYEPPYVTGRDGKPGRMCLLLAEDIVRLLYQDGGRSTGFKRGNGSGAARALPGEKQARKRK